jgi:hypothetical protein
MALLGIALIGWAATPLGQLGYVPRCRHDQNAVHEDRDRRAQALTLAKAINAAQAQLVQQTQHYQPLSGLGDLPPVPRGFELNLYADRWGYMFGLKDALDACRFAVFSDEGGLLYEQSALNAPVIAQ